MTRQERLEALTSMIADIHGAEAGSKLIASVVEDIEAEAIDAYLANVPLPEGWGEGQFAGSVCYYVDEKGTERVYANKDRVEVRQHLLGWPPIPLPVLIRAAVQCHRLREQR